MLDSIYKQFIPLHEQAQKLKKLDDEIKAQKWKEINNKIARAYKQAEPTLKVINGGKE